MENPRVLVDYEHIRQVATAAIRLLNPRLPMGPDLFGEHSRVGVNVAVELVCLRRSLAAVTFEVYLTQRAATEARFPGEWHCPGSVWRSGDIVEDVFARLEGKELGCGLVGVPVHVATLFPTRESLAKEVGTFIGTVWLGTLAGQGRGQWYPTNQLPTPIVYSHRERIIPAAVKAFLAREQNP